LQIPKVRVSRAGGARGKGASAMGKGVWNARSKNVKIKGVGDARVEGVRDTKGKGVGNASGMPEVRVSGMPGLRGSGALEIGTPETPEARASGMGGRDAGGKSVKGTRGKGTKGKDVRDIEGRSARDARDSDRGRSVKMSEARTCGTPERGVFIASGEMRVSGEFIEAYGEVECEH